MSSDRSVARSELWPPSTSAIRFQTLKRPTPRRRYHRLLLSCALVSLSTSCMSLEHLVDPKQRLSMYGGTKSSYEYIEDDSSPFFGTFVRILDLPLTVVLDTLLLPVSAPVQLSR